MNVILTNFEELIILQRYNIANKSGTTAILPKSARRLTIKRAARLLLEVLSMHGIIRQEEDRASVGVEHKVDMAAKRAALVLRRGGAQRGRRAHGDDGARAHGGREAVLGVLRRGGGGDGVRQNRGGGRQRAQG